MEEKSVLFAYADIIDKAYGVCWFIGNSSCVKHGTALLEGRKSGAINCFTAFACHFQQPLLADGLQLGSERQSSPTWNPRQFKERGLNKLRKKLNFSEEVQLLNGQVI
ncbi:MAG: hypothetical protein R3C62_10250 [Chloroflexota bacterium]